MVQEAGSATKIGGVVDNISSFTSKFEDMMECAPGEVAAFKDVLELK